MANIDPNNRKPDQANTVRISGADLLRLDQEMSARAGHDIRREFIRMPFHKQALQIEMVQPGGVKTSLRYACRNLCSTGIGFLHSAYVHIGTRCTVNLPDLEGNLHPILAKVVRCQHYRGVIHEVGLQFLEPINIRDFVRLDLMEGGFTMEAVDCGKLTGAVLHVDDSSMDRRLVRHYLRDTNLNVVNADDGKSAILRCGEHFDLILCEQSLPDMAGAQLIEQFRAKGVQTPVILLCADATLTARDSAKSAAVNALLTKPFKQEDLLRAIAEFLLIDATDTDTGGPLYTTLTPADSRYAVMPEFVEELKSIVGRLNQTLEQGNMPALKRLCTQLRASASGLGFPTIAGACDTVLAAITANKPVADVTKQIRGIMGMCLRVRARDAEQPTKKAG